MFHSYSKLHCQVTEYFIYIKSFASSMVDLAMSSKGQAAGAAVLIAIIAGVLIMFIILIPPADRAELLGEQDSSSSGGSSGSSGKAGGIKNFIFQIPGRIDCLNSKEI